MPLADELSKTKIVRIDPIGDPLWQQLIDRQGCSAFQSPLWMQVLTDTYGLEVRAYVLLDADGVPLAGIPFCQIEDMMGKRVISLPFSDYCGPVAGDAVVHHALAEKLLEARCPVKVRSLSDAFAQSHDAFTVVDRAKWHGIDLTREADTIWRSLHEAARRAIRKAEKNGITVRIAQDAEDVRAFYNMHLRIRKYKYHLLAQPYRFFQNIWWRFNAEGRIALMLAVHQGEVIGGTLFLKWQDTIYYKFNASHVGRLAHRPNDLLIWHGILHGKAQGLTKFDFGLSDWDQTGLVRYKRKFATEEKTIFFMQHVPEAAPNPDVQQLRALLGTLTGLFVDETVPDAVTGKAGDVLYRFFV